MLPDISAIILSAGYSSRMGKAKALLQLGDQSVLERVAENFKINGIEAVTVVTGHHREGVEEESSKHGLKTVFNPDYDQGMFSSVKTGVAALPEKCSAFFITPVDHALFRRGTVKLVLKAFENNEYDIIFPCFKGKPGHPPLISSAIIPRILAHDGNGGLRKVLEDYAAEFPDKILNLEVPDKHILFDMDTPDLYAEALRVLPKIDIPDKDECEIILNDVCKVPEKGLAHARQVGKVAMRIGHELKWHRDHGPDLSMIYAGAILHDLAKGSPKHEQEGGRILSELGFDRIADIVAAHRDVYLKDGRSVAEKEIVYIADKLVRGSQFVSVVYRFEDKMKIFKDDAEAVSAIKRRLGNALRVKESIEHETGKILEDLSLEDGI
ncbi:DVU_1551 family NTP transferase [Maridesulfovibrio bastinii]|uniref:DVU_1551 family NTP transferase n=1 Tax=Maridesulfovibrio bastinii TaxID=47157 RepID=UPI0005526F86|nr:NTP transferase domain-containing protein [Maridesulfovibrio bastinii]